MFLTPLHCHMKLSAVLLREVAATGGRTAATREGDGSMSIKAATRRYERWLRKQCDVVDADLCHKHERMCKNAFVFLRATYYRWAEKIEEWCPELRDAPEVLAIGDIHTENFGTWRDSDGRLVWGV